MHKERRHPPLPPALFPRQHPRTRCAIPRSHPPDVANDRESHVRKLRERQHTTLIASQLSVKDWHASIGDPNLADAICDRLLHKAHRIELKGPTMRDTKPKNSSEARR
jgi:hypothetical protein